MRLGKAVDQLQQRVERLALDGRRRGHAGNRGDVRLGENREQGEVGPAGQFVPQVAVVEFRVLAGLADGQERTLALAQDFQGLVDVAVLLAGMRFLGLAPEARLVGG